MNSKKLCEILKPYIKYQESKTSFEIHTLHWRIELATNHDVVFYKINNAPKDLEKFNSLRKASSYGLLITPYFDKLEGKEKILMVDPQYWLEVQKVVCDHIWGAAQGNVKLVGVTGTNGKTTTVEYCRQLAAQLGKEAGSVGTLGLRVGGDQCENTGLTSPPYLEIRRILFENKDLDALFFEVSSHALSQQRFYKIKFDYVAWTSFSRDHLDYHGTEEAYFEAKRRIFNHLKQQGRCFFARGCEDLYQRIDDGRSKLAPIFCSISNDDNPAFLQIDFNRRNMDIACALVSSLWPGVQTQLSMKEIVNIDGRFTTFKSDEALVIVDFAHTPDALENLLQEVRRSYPLKPLIVLFGCGGDRDKGKRPQMGAIAERFADEVFITSDNPRYEDPAMIVKDIERGFTGGQYHIELDRRKSICNAWQRVCEIKGILVIAGKGHENYIEIKGQRRPYSDINTVEKLIEGVA